MKIRWSSARIPCAPAGDSDGDGVDRVATVAVVQATAASARTASLTAERTAAESSRHSEGGVRLLLLPGPGVQNQRIQWLLREVERLAQRVGEILAHRWTAVRSRHRLRVEPRTAEEPVLDQLQVGIERHGRVIDGARLRPRADHEAG